MALAVVLVGGAVVAAPVFGQYVGTARFHGRMTDFYRVPMQRPTGPCLNSPHPKWTLTAPQPPALRMMADAHRMHPGLDNPADRLHAPTIGTINAICLLVDFSDRPAGNIPGVSGTRQSYIDMLFTTGVYATGSMREYYLEDSYGLLDIQGTVANGTGGAVAGWFRAPQTHAYYCANQMGVGGYQAVPGVASNSQELVENAIALADPIVNFANYDSADPDTMVDCLHVVHAGTSVQLSGLTTDLATVFWQTSANVNVDGVYCLDFALEAEDDAVGGFAHETGHILGAPDLYDYDPWTPSGPFINVWDDNDYPVTEWCIMGRGSWGGPNTNGTCPSHHCGWMKSLVFGWVGVTPITPAQGSQVIPVTDLETNNAPTSFYEVQINANEWLLIENRYSANPAITFDKWSWWPQPPAARRDGIIIYHLDLLGPTGTGRLNDAWPSNKDYFLWVEDPGMVPDPVNPATMTAAPLMEGKANAAFRSDGVGRLNRTNANNPVLILGVTPKPMYPAACDNQGVLSNIEWIDTLSTPGPTMNIWVQFSPIAMTFGAVTKGVTTLGAGNQAQVDYYNLNVLQSAFVDDANSVQVNADPGSTYTYQNLSTGSGTTHQWQADPIQATGQVPGITQTITCNFYEQWQATVTLNGTDATYSASHVARTLLGQNALLSGLYNVWQGWCDAGTPLTFSAQTAGSPPRPAVGKCSWIMGAAKTVTVNYDAANPTVTIASPPNNDVFWGGPSGPNQTISGTASDDVGLRRVDVSLNGGAWQLATGKTSWTVNVTLAPGRNQVKARAKDKAGKFGYDTITVNYDTSAPTVTFRSPSIKTAYRTPNVTVNGLACDDVGLKRAAIRVGSTSPWTDLHTGPPFPRRYVWSHPLTLNPGANVVQVRAWDRARRGTTKSLTLYYDTQSPTVTITQPLAGARVRRPTLGVKGTAGDNIGLKSVHLKVSGGVWQPVWSGKWRNSVNWNGVVGLAPGRNVVRAKATDMSGNTATTSHAVFLVGTTAADVTAAGADMVMVSALAAQSTKAGGASCSFVLSAPATVRAEVLNLAGRAVAVIARDRACTDGLNTLLWSGQAANGLPVPDGVYIVNIEATSANGACARALGRLYIQR